MSILQVDRGGPQVPIEIRALSDGNDVFVVWRPDAIIPECAGFALYRRHLDGPRKGHADVISNRISFRSEGPFRRESSETSPFRRFSWTDHIVYGEGDIQYQVKPVLRMNNAALLVDGRGASPWSNVVKLGPEAGESFSCYFNRGLVMSQFMTSYLQRHGIDPAHVDRFKETISQETEGEIRQFLGGNLLTKLLELLDRALKNKQHIFLAIFELKDEELTSGLEKLGPLAHVVLSNGPHTSKEPDANSDSRERLEKARVDVRNRMLRQGLGHNKFLVMCDSQNKPLAVWTGSTNWSPTAICTQINNSVLIENSAVARVYLDQWHALSDAGSEFPTSLVKSNSSPRHCEIGNVRVDTWFTRTQSREEMAAACKLIDNAKRGILFLMFSPGSSSLLEAITRRAGEKNLYVHGVVSTMAPGSTDQSKVSLVSFGGKKLVPLKIVQPQGIQHPLSHWAVEVTRNEFLAKVGHAIVHSKVVVIDPFTNPVVITGSHNFSKSASEKNDENMVIVKGNRDLARAYAVNAKSVYDHFRWRAFVAEAEREHKDPDFFVKQEKKWQYGQLESPQKQLELSFWLER
jgi:hypothetical protein